IVRGFVWLSAIVKCNWIGPNVPLPLTYLLSIVLPVHTMPVDIILIARLKAGQNGGSRIGGGCVDHDSTRGGTATVVDPVSSSTCTLLFGSLYVVTERARSQNVYRTLKFTDVVLRYESR